jgi:hypothetical protein
MSMLFKRKFRWTVEWRDQRTWQLIAPQSFVKISARPSSNVEETEIDFLNQKTFIPGKLYWQDMTITYGDIDNDEGGAMMFYWLSQQWKALEEGGGWKCEPTCVILRLYDGCGGCMEMWYLENSIVSAVEFGELSYGSECEVNITIKYGEADWVHPDPETWTKGLKESDAFYSPVACRTHP